jgi:uncharacterized protein GlcG (DUF336 family)
VPEIIEDGVSGTIVDSIEAAVEAVKQVSGLSRHRVRAAFERRFTAARMARDYLTAYRSLQDQARPSLCRTRSDTLEICSMRKAGPFREHSQAKLD